MTAPTDQDLPSLAPTPPGLYRHYKGNWYEVLDTARCSETLAGMTVYRALYGKGLDSGALWVRPAAMFAEVGMFGGQHRPRFARHDPADIVLADLPTAHALAAHLRHQARLRGIDLDHALRPPPPEPTTCCGRGCNGCVWEGFYDALAFWCEDAQALCAQDSQAGEQVLQAGGATGRDAGCTQPITTTRAPG